MPILPHEGGLHLTRVYQRINVFCTHLHNLSYCVQNHVKLYAAKSLHPLAATLYDLLLLSEPGFIPTTRDGQALVDVEAAILRGLGIESFVGFSSEAIGRLAALTLDHFKMHKGVYRFPLRRCCWLLGPSDAKVLKLLGG